MPAVPSVPSASAASAPPTAAATPTPLPAAPTGPRTAPSGAAVRRCVALLMAGALLPLAAACSSDDSGGDGGGQGEAAGAAAGGARAAALDVPSSGRDDVRSGGTLRWAVDSMPRTLNAYHPDAGAATDRIAGATLPALFTLDSSARPQLNPDYLRSAEVTEQGNRQTVVYKLQPKARWSDGRALGAADFTAQWQALNGRHRSYQTARNLGYDRIARVTRGADEHEVKVVFRKPYADWKSLFTPLYPKSVTGSSEKFNNGARDRLPVSAGPFAVKPLGKKDLDVTLVRNRHWWGDTARLKRIMLRTVTAEERQDALMAGAVDLAEVDTRLATRITAAHGGRQGGAGGEDAKAERGAEQDAAAPGAEHGRADKADSADKAARHPHRKLTKEERARAAENRKLRRYTVRKALGPAYTQLALNGSSGPLSDERVRRAIARAIDRPALARQALAGTGLPAGALGSHLRMPSQDGYSDNSDALGDRDVEAAQALLSDAGWKGAVAATPDTGKADAKKAEPKASAKADDKASAKAGDKADKAGEAADGKNGDTAPGLRSSGSHVGTVRAKAGKPLVLRFVLPGGQGTSQLRATGERIVKALQAVGVRAQIKQVDGEHYFEDHIAAGNYDMALYSWPGTAYPATDALPIFAKPEVAADGSLMVEQNYTRVGTDQIDQLLTKASGELDDGDRADLIKRADARIWAAAGSVPLYQRPQLVAARENLVNAGAFGFQTPRYQDIGFKG